MMPTVLLPGGFFILFLGLFLSSDPSDLCHVDDGPHVLSYLFYFNFFIFFIDPFNFLKMPKEDIVYSKIQCFIKGRGESVLVQGKSKIPIPKSKSQTVKAWWGTAVGPSNQ